MRPEAVVWLTRRFCTSIDEPLTNAGYAHATSGGKLAIRLPRKPSTARSSQQIRLVAGALCKLSVEDTGAGIPPRYVSVSSSHFSPPGVAKARAWAVHRHAYQGCGRRDHCI